MRRLRVEKVQLGEVQLSQQEAHHARDVLRLTVGTEVEVFDDRGELGRGEICELTKSRVVLRVREVSAAAEAGLRWTILSAVPKGNRADWMVEKLSELGTHSFVPLATARSVVVPEGKNKAQRWQRLADESAKQSKRRGVMQIGEVGEVAAMVKRCGDEKKTIGW